MKRYKDENIKKLLEYLKEASDEELLELLFFMGDSLSKKVVDEIVSRDERMIEPLWDIIANESNWRDDKDGGWWAVIHATFIIGAIGGKEAITPLIMSLRNSDIFECDWIYETIPSIFGHIGPTAIEPLKMVVCDKSNRWFIRVTALESITAITIKYPELEREVFDFTASILNDMSEDMLVRGLAGNALLDFNQKRYEKSLLEFVRQEEEISEEDPYYDCFLTENDIIKAFSSNEKRLEHYDRYWLDFYSEKEISVRQKRWRKEHIKDSWFGFPFRWWEDIKLKRSMAKFKKEFKDKN